MDGFSTHIQPPPEYISVKWISDIFVLGMGLGWGSHYAVMTYVSIKDRTYCLNIMALCADFAWEVVYGFVYPSNDWAERVVIFVALLVNIFVMYAAIRATPNEWQRSPLIMQNSLLVFVATTVLWLGGMLSMAAQLGPARAYSFGAILCQMLISVGQVCQLLSRNNTRGASYTLWYVFLAPDIY
jgi:paspaline synthase